MKKIVILPFFLFCFTLFSAPLTIKDCVNKAMLASTDVAKAEQDQKLADNDIGSYTAPFYPSLGISLSDTLAGYDASGNPVRILSFYPDAYSATLSASMNLFNRGKDSLRLSYYRKKKEEADLELFRVRQGAAWDSIKAFYETLKAEKSLMVTESVLKQRQENLKLTESLYRAGIRSKSYFLNAKIQLGNSEAAVLSGRNDLLTAQAALNTLLGAGPGDPLELEDDLTFVKFEKTRDEALASAFNNRPEWLMLLKQKDESAINIDLASRDLLPSVSLDASYGMYLDKYARDSSMWTHKGALDQNSSWGLTLSLSYPIFDGWADSIKADNAVILGKITDIRYNSLLRSITKEVFLEYNDLQRLFSQVPIYEQQAVFAKENLEITRSKYKEGTASFLELIDAEVSYSSSQIDWYQSIYDYKSQTADLLKAMGVKLY